MLSNGLCNHDGSGRVKSKLKLRIQALRAETIANGCTEDEALSAAAKVAELIDGAVRAELGRFKTSADYATFRHQERHLANASFALGMVASIADRLVALKAGRDQVNASTGRGLVVLKTSVVDAEFDKLDLNIRTQRSTSRMVSMSAYEAGGAAGASLAINPGLGGAGKRR